MQLEETVVGVMGERAALVRDYSAVDTERAASSSMLHELAALPHQELLDFGRLAELLGYDRKTSTIDFTVSPRGYRALSRIPRLPRLVAQKVVQRFGDLDAIVNATEDELGVGRGVGPARAQGDPRGTSQACRRSTSSTDIHEPDGRSRGRPNVRRTKFQS